MRSVFKVKKEGHSYPILKAMQLPCKITSKIQLIENKEVTLLA